MISSNIQYIFGIISILLIFPGQYIYIKSIINGTTKPHLYTLLIFFIVMTIGFCIQFLNGGGPGSWLLGGVAVSQLIQFFLSIKYGASQITKSDTYILILAFLCIPCYIYSTNQFVTLFWVIIIDIFAFIPTIRKSIQDPYSENLTSWNIGNIRSMLSMLALTKVNVFTLTYPLIMTLVSIGFVLQTLYYRRKKAVILND